MWTGYASHCEWCLHQNSHPTCRQQVRSWSDLLTSRGRCRATRRRPRRSGGAVSIRSSRPLPHGIVPARQNLLRASDPQIRHVIAGEVRHSGMRQPNAGIPEFGNIIVEVGNSRLGWRRPESILTMVVMDSGFEATPRNDGHMKIVRWNSGWRGPVGAMRHLTECPAGKSVSWLSSPNFKNISIPVRPKSLHIHRRPGPQRGVSRSSRTLGMGCGGRGSALDETCRRGR
jgi:hypothetical protein